jgi:hypothetical protein
MLGLCWLMTTNNETETIAIMKQAVATTIFLLKFKRVPLAL